MINEIENEHFISPEEAEIATKNDEYRRKLSYFTFGALSVFVLLLACGFMYQRRSNSRLNGEFQVRRVETLWDKNVSKRALIMERSRENITDEILKSSLVRPLYLQKKIVSGDENVEVGPISYDKMIVIGDFHKITLAAIQHRWDEAFSLGKQFIAKYRISSPFLDSSDEKHKKLLQDLNLEELLLPVQCLRHIAVARNLGDPKNEIEAIQELLDACGKTIVDWRKEERNSSIISPMFNYCFETIKEGSVGIKEYIIGRWDALHPIQDD